MNIFGRVFGGLLVLISLGWLASIAGVRPGWMSNQINSETPTGTSNLAAPAKSNATGATPATGSKATVSKFDGGTQKTTTGTTTAGAKAGTPEVEANPRAAGNTTTGTGTKSVGNTATGTTPSPSPAPTTVAAPVSAGW
jgi:hypothetical protein